jgi:hypothetical protein
VQLTIDPALPPGQSVGNVMLKVAGAKQPRSIERPAMEASAAAA